MGGYLVGGIMFGQLSDTWGRRPVLLISKKVVLLNLLFVALSPLLHWYGKISICS